MNMLKMMKDAAMMRSKMSQMEKSLRENIIEVSENGVAVKMNAKLEIMDLRISPEVIKNDLKKIESDILRAVNSALKKSREAMIDETKKITGGLNIPELM